MIMRWRVFPWEFVPWGVIPLRIAVGVVFVMHGGQKLFVFSLPATTKFMANVGIPAPEVAAVLVTAVEFLGGLAILLGGGCRVASALLAVDMLVALVAVHLRAGFFLPRGFEFVFTLLGACLTLAALGPGKLSIESLARRWTA
jgi:putative oxidoreductase